MPLISQLFLLALLAFFTLYLAYEWVRWIGGNRAGLTPGQFRRRMVGGLLLELDLLLWLLWPVLAAGRRPAEQLLYLLFALLLIFVPMLLAVREAAFVTRQYVRWRGEMVRNYSRGETAPPPDQDAHDPRR